MIPQLVGDTWTIRKLLDWTSRDFDKRRLDAPRLDAELLLAHSLGVDRVNLYLDLDRPLGASELARFRELVVRRRDHEPVAYILGHRDFFGRRFEVGPPVLIPRPDTETLIEQALECLDAEASARVLDIGTGSGAIAVTIACERPNAQVWAVDVSAPALAIAAANAEAHEVAHRVHVVESDLFEAVPSGEPYDVIVANPPYIRSDELKGLQEDVRKHEPELALDGGPDGLTVIRRLVDGAKAFAASGAHLLFEIGVQQADAVRVLIDGGDGWSLRGVHRDLAGVERVVHLVRLDAE